MTARLIAEDGTLKGDVLLLDTGEEWHIGRDPDANQLVLQDSKVSRQHGLIRKSNEGYILENLSQTNPLMLAGKALANPTLLKEGDRIKIGGSTFLFTTKETPVKEGAFHLEDVGKELDVEPSYNTIFEEAAEPQREMVDLSLRQRWLLKIIGGPQSGAEFSMEKGRSYIIGSDATLADIILYDLSVSRKHAKLAIQDNDVCLIEDLGSRNGVIINGAAISSPTELKGSEVVNLGTTSFMVIDREKASETILSTAPEKLTEEAALAAQVAEDKPLSRVKHLFRSREAQIITFTLAVLALFAAFGISSLFTEEPVITETRDYHSEIREALKEFPEVSFSYNKKTNQLFLAGDVLTSVDKVKLEYALKNLGFIGTTDDTNVIIDQNIWMQMNTLIGQNASWSGVSMYATKPGVFVISGYLKTRQESAALSDWLNLNFNYLDKLENKIIVEENLAAEIGSTLFASGFNGVTTDFNNGELTMTGFIPEDRANDFARIVEKFQETPGIRSIKNYVTPLTPAEAVVDLSDRFRVTGFSLRNNTNVYVVVNGQILGRGEQIDGMIITSIQEHTIFLEKNGLKFKIEYNS